MSKKFIYLYVLLLLFTPILVSSQDGTIHLNTPPQEMSKEQIYEIKTEILDWNYKFINVFLVVLSIILAVLVFLLAFLGWKGLSSVRESLRNYLMEEMEKKIDIAVGKKLDASAEETNGDILKIENTSENNKITRRAFENE